MARERMVTRTMVSTKATVLGMDIVNAKAISEELEITGTFADNDILLKALKKEYDRPDYSVVAVQASEEIEKLYGMKEIEFLKYATELDPETRKRIEE